MSESRSGKTDDITARIKDSVEHAEGSLDVDGLMHRIRETVGKAGSDVDTDAIVTRVKEVVAQAGGKVDTDKLRHWLDEVDRDRLKEWLDEAKTLGAGAASLLGTRGEKLVERAPGAFDKLAGAAKEKLGSLTGDEGLLAEGRIERLKGQITETIASMSDRAEGDVKDTVDTIKEKVDKGTGRG